MIKFAGFRDGVRSFGFGLLRVAIIGMMPFAAGSVLAQDASPLALDFGSAQDRLVDRSDAIDASTATVRSKEEQEGATRSLGRPEVDFEIQVLEYQKTLYLPLGSLAPVASSFGIGDPLRFQQEKTGLRPIMTVTVPLYTGGKIASTKSGAQAQVVTAQAERDGVIEDQVLSLAEAYFGQQLAEQVTGVRRNALSGLEQHVADAKALERERFISRAQRLQAEVARDEAARDLAKALSDLSSANTVLARLLRAPEGVRPTTPLTVPVRRLAPLEQFLESAMRDHPQLRKIDALRREAEAGVETRKSELRPNIYGFGQYNFDRRDSLLTDPDWSFGVGVKYKLTSGIGRRQMVESARDVLASADASFREAQTQIGIGVSKYWNETEAARERYQLTGKSIEAAQENLRLQNAAYQELQVTSLDVIDAQLGVERAQIQRTQAAYDYIVALARLLHASGQTMQLASFLP